MLLADIVDQNRGTGQVFLIVACVLFLIVLLSYLFGGAAADDGGPNGRRNYGSYGPLFMAGGLFFLTLGLIFY